MARLATAAFVLVLAAISCSRQPELVQVECEKSLQVPGSTEYYKVRRVKYWSDGTTTYEPIYDGLDVQDGGWQFIYTRKGVDPCP